MVAAIQRQSVAKIATSCEMILDYKGTACCREAMMVTQYGVKTSDIDR